MATIRQLRRAADMTQQDLADALGVQQTVISRWERGDVKPSAAALAALASALGTTPEEITLLERLTPKTVLTKEGYEGTTPAERRRIVKQETVRRLSKWGNITETYIRTRARIPDDWWDKYTPDHLADVIDLLKQAYEDGRDDPRPTE